MGEGEIKDLITVILFSKSELGLDKPLAFGGAEVGTESRVSPMLGKCSATEPHLQFPPLCSFPFSFKA